MVSDFDELVSGDVRSQPGSVSGGSHMEVDVSSQATTALKTEL